MPAPPRPEAEAPGPTRRTVRRIVYEETHHNDPIPFAAWVDQCLAAIPEAHRASADVQTWGEGYHLLIVSYDRPETDEEMAVRLLRDAREAPGAKERRENNEREMLRLLKIKYEGDGT